MVDQALLKSALLDAAELLKDHTLWTRGVYEAKDLTSGKTCFCAVGAIRHALIQKKVPVVELRDYEYCVDDLCMNLCNKFLETYNDNYAKNNTDVVDMLQKLAERV